MAKMDLTTGKCKPDQTISNYFATESLTIAPHFTTIFPFLPRMSVTTVDSWPMMRSPVPIVFIFTFYLMTVYLLGPRFMKNRDPFDLKRVILVYNIFQIAASTAIVAGVKTKSSTYLLELMKSNLFSVPPSRFHFQEHLEVCGKYQTWRGIPLQHARHSRVLVVRNDVAICGVG